MNDELPSSITNQKETESMPAESLVKESPSALAWREWLDEYGPRLLLYARQQSRSQEDAEDILQSALIKLVEKINSGEFSGGQNAWMPYLYTTIRRQAIDLGRKNDRRTRREEKVSTDTAYEARDSFHPWFDSEKGDTETQKILERELKELPKKFSEVIVLKIWNDRTFAEIGEILGISQNTAASRYRYGLEALQKKLSGARKRGDISIG